MRKAKAKTKALKRKSSPKTRRNLEIDSTLKARLEAEFARAVRSAKAYADDPLQLRGLFEDAAEAATSLPTDSFGDIWPYFQTMLRLIRAYYRGEYHEVTESTLVILIARSEEHTSELQSHSDLVCRLLLEKKKKKK